MSTEYERLFVGHLILDPTLFKKGMLSEADISDETLRLVYREIQKQKGKATFQHLCDKFNKSLGANYLPKLYGGLPSSDAANLPSYIRKIRKERIDQDILKLIAQGVRSGTTDRASIRSLDEQGAALEAEEASHEPMSFCLADVQEEESLWLWENYIPLESITLINGDPDAGKSWWCMDMACRTSTGRIWPDGAQGGKPQNTYYMTYENHMARAIKKRIRLLGGDGKRIFCYNAKSPLHLSLAAPGGIEELEKELIKLNVANGGLLVIDPILDFTGGKCPNAQEIVRALLTPIIAMLERLKIACLMVGHLNKDQVKSAIYRAGGSTGGWVGKARAAFLIARSNEDRNKRFAFRIKSNDAWPEPQDMEFEIVDGKLIFALTTENVNEVLNPTVRGRPPTASIKASSIVAALFHDRDEVPSAEVEAHCKALGVKPATLKRVKHDDGYLSEYGQKSLDSEPDFWVWKKPCA